MNQPLARRADRPPLDLMAPITTLEDAIAVCDVLAKSELVPYALRGKPASIFHIIITGQSLKLHWIEALRVLYVPGPGQIGLRGQFLLSQLRKANHRYSFEEGEDYCIFRLERGDTKEKFEAKFTIEDAIGAGLLKRNADGDLIALSRDGKPLPWQLWTKRLLRWRSVSDGVSVGAPEVSLGFEIEGDLPAEPPQDVQLRPETPAPPGPDAREAAPSDSQAEQALRDLDERSTPERVLQPENVTLLDPIHNRLHSYGPDQAGMGQVLAVQEESTGGGESAPEPDFPLADMPIGESTGGGESVGEPVEDFTGQAPAVTEPTEAELRRDRAVLAGLFTEMGYEPKRYRAEVLHACSVFAQRHIKGVRDLTPAELYGLTAALEGLKARTDELALVSRLAEQVDTWAEVWRTTDGESYAVYEAAVQRGGS